MSWRGTETNYSGINRNYMIQPLFDTKGRLARRPYLQECRRRLNLWLGHLRSSLFSPDVKAHVILDLNFRPYTTSVNPRSVPSSGNEDGYLTNSGPIRVSLSVI